MNVEVRNANLSKEFIDFSYSSIRFEFRSYCRKLEDIEEEVVFNNGEIKRKRRISRQINR